MIPNIFHEFFKVSKTFLEKIADFFGVHIVVLMDQTVAESRHVGNRFREKTWV